MIAMKRRHGKRGWFVYRRSDYGRWVLHFRETPGRWRDHRIPAEYTSKRDAEHYGAAWLDERSKVGHRPVVAVEPAPDRGPTLNEVAERWLAFRRSLVTAGDLAPSTVVANEGHLTDHILPVLGEERVVELAETAGKLATFVRALRAKERRPGAVYGAVTVRNVAFSLSALFEDAMGEEWLSLPGNPMRHPTVKRALPKVPKLTASAIIYLSRRTAAQVMTCVAAPEIRRVRYVVAFTSGCDLGELQGLTFEDVDFDEREVRISKQLKDDRRLGPPKRESRHRRLPLHPLAARSLRAWKATGWAKWTGCHPTLNDPLFPDEHGRFYYPFSAAKWMRRDLVAVSCADNIGGKKVDFHSTRRSFRTWLVDASVEEAIIDELLGHAAKTIGRRHYTGAGMERLRRAVEIIKLDVALSDVLELPLRPAASSG
ncbi:tyrosine-type recombinase/integrase [Desulfobulbus sp. AH-315-M07]|nr:tyrosine-type recombinase/integrase [Desulfobulbus sp. AH-315-M07]